MKKVIRVLIVDDHFVVRNGLRLTLSNVDDIVIAAEAESVKEAFAVLAKSEIDVALVDINLPGASGLDFSKKCQETFPDLKVLILSMYAEDAYALRALKNGARGYLTKNADGPTVIGAIRQVARGEKYISPAMAEKLANMIFQPTPTSHEALSDRELQVLKLLATGASLVQIGDALHLSPSTVTTYRARILEKMNMKSNAELTRYAVENGLLS